MTFFRNLFIALSLLCSSFVFAADTVNINTASAQVLATVLKGIGDSKAQAIVAYRTEHGNFSSIFDLTKVKGVGQKTVENNQEILVVE